MLTLVLAGCAGNPADLEPEAAPGTDPLWHVHCETSLKPRVEAGEDPEAAVAKGWIDARTPNDFKIYIAGTLEDGFVQVRQVLSDDPGWSLNPEKPYLHLRQVCRQTMARRRDGERYRPGLVRTYNPDSGVYTSFVFDDWSNRSEITRLVVFGDSLSDTGDLRRRLKVAPRQPYWVGRFANGPIWTDYLEVSADLALQNHARGGAMAAAREPMDNEELLQRLYTNGQFFVSGDIGDQVERYASIYLEDRQVERSEQTVAILWAGANDYISKEAFESSISALLGQPFSEEGYRELVSTVVDALQGNLLRLRTLGIERFLVINLPDLGKTPMVVHNDSFLVSRDFDSDDERLLEFSRRLGDLTRWHNAALADMVMEFQAESPGVQVVLADANILFAQAFDAKAGAEAMGFDLSAQRVVLTSGRRGVRTPGQLLFGHDPGAVRLELDRMRRRIANGVLGPGPPFHLFPLLDRALARKPRP